MWMLLQCGRIWQDKNQVPTHGTCPTAQDSSTCHYETILGRMASSTLRVLWSGSCHFNLFEWLAECSAPGQGSATCIAWCLCTNSVCPLSSAWEATQRKKELRVKTCAYEWKRELLSSVVVHWGAVICSFSHTEVTCLVYLAFAVLALCLLLLFFFLY